MAAEREFFLELKQEGSRVTGSMQIIPGGLAARAGPIEGTVSGDAFHFRQPSGTVAGELTVSGEEMNGRVTLDQGKSPISLRRVDSSAQPGSPPR